jgi:hypothetical protein
MRLGELSGSWTQKVPRGWGTQGGHGRSTCIPPYLTLCISFILFLNHVLYDKTISRNMFPWIVESFQANDQTQVMSHRTSDSQSLSQKHRWQPSANNWYLKWEQSCETESPNCGIWCYVQVDSDRIVLNFRSLYQGWQRVGELFGLEQTHLSGVRNTVWEYRELFVVR